MKRLFKKLVGGGGIRFEQVFGAFQTSLGEGIEK